MFWIRRTSNDENGWESWHLRLWTLIRTPISCAIILGPMWAPFPMWIDNYDWCWQGVGIVRSFDHPYTYSILDLVAFCIVPVVSELSASPCHELQALAWRLMPVLYWPTINYIATNRSQARIEIGKVSAALLLWLRSVAGVQALPDHPQQRG